MIGATLFWALVYCVGAALTYGVCLWFEFFNDKEPAGAVAILWPISILIAAIVGALGVFVLLPVLFVFERAGAAIEFTVRRLKPLSKSKIKAWKLAYKTWKLRPRERAKDTEQGPYRSRKVRP